MFVFWASGAMAKVELRLGPGWPSYVLCCFRLYPLGTRGTSRRADRHGESFVCYHSRYVPYIISLWGSM